jgi:hypothetical protein
MPVANANARTITTKIVFMTRSLSVATPVSMAEPARRSVTGITDGVFTACRRAGSSLDQRRRCDPAKYLYSLMFRFNAAGAGGLDRGQNSTLVSAPEAAATGLVVSRRVVAASSPAWSCMLGRPARSWSLAAAVLEECACRRIDLVPDRFLMRRASPSAERRRPTANRPRQWAVIIARSPHRDSRSELARTTSPPQGASEPGLSAKSRGLVEFDPMLPSLQVPAAGELVCDLRQ